MSGFLEWRERPWTIWMIAVLGLADNVWSVVTDAGVGNLALTAISLALLAGLWHGNPGVRLYYIIVLAAAVVVSVIAVVNDPGTYWSGFAASVAMFALMLAPPTHRWAQRREQEREQQRAQRRGQATPDHP